MSLPILSELLYWNDTICCSSFALAIDLTMDAINAAFARCEEERRNKKESGRGRIGFVCGAEGS
jgi:hypothetical protein